MFWLAGLMGIAGAGAASFLPSETDADEDLHGMDGDFPDPDEALRLHGDLLEHLGADQDQPDMGFIPASGAAGAFPMEFDGPLRHEDTIFDDEEQQDNAQSLETEGFEESVADTGPDLEDTHSGLSQVLLGDWIANGPEDEVFDYEAATESLVLIWDDMDAGAGEPDVRVEQDPFDEEVMHILMNGKSVAEVYGDPNLTAADVTMIPLSSALIVGLEPV